MRGSDKRPGELFSYVDLEQRVRTDHPLRVIRALTDTALEALSGDFAALYSGLGRPSIAPEMLLRAMLLQAFYSVRSERQLMERLEFDLLFRWFVGIGVDDPVWDHSTFSKNRDRLLDGEIAAKFLTAIVAQPRIKRLLSSEHFSVDGTLIEAWASIKSFKPKEPRDAGGTHAGGRNVPADFRARSAPTRRIAARPTRMPDCTARGRGWRRSCALLAMG
jgi:transposase